MDEVDVVGGVRGLDRRLLSALHAHGADPRVAAAARLAGMGVKRVVRRPRPAYLEPLVRTARRHSFPSSHASSAAAAVAVLAYGALGAPRVLPAAVPLAAAMCLSRLVVGVHHPSDVAAGAALGALTARLGALSGERPWLNARWPWNGG